VNFISIIFYTILEAQKYMKKLNFQMKSFSQRKYFSFELYFILGTLLSRRRFRRIAANVVAAWRGRGSHKGSGGLHT